MKKSHLFVKKGAELMQKVDVTDMSDELLKILLTYKDDITQATKEAVDEVSNGVMNEIKSHITWNDKKYSRSFELKTIYDNKRGKYVIWHVKDGMYRLTHLLELGHLTRDGRTQSRKYPHVVYGQEYAKNNLERVIKEKIAQCNN